MLGLIPGLFSIWGMGHFFAGSDKRGLAFFLLGLFMAFVAPVALIFFVQGLGDLLLLLVIGVIAWVALWLFQSVDAYREAGGD
jgi:hypothetical protein